MRKHLPSSHEALKAVTRELVDANGGLKYAARRTRVEMTALSEYGNRHLADRFMPVDIAYDLEIACQEPILSRELFRLITEASPSAHPIEPFKFISHITDEIGDLASVTIEAEADGKWSYAERKQWLKEARQARDLLNRQIDAVEAAASLHTAETG